jgi:hypothetical protein
MQITDTPGARFLTRIDFDGVMDALDQLDNTKPRNASNASLARDYATHLKVGDAWCCNGRKRDALVAALSSPAPALMAEIDSVREKLTEATPALAGREKLRRVRRRGEDFGDEVGNQSRYLMRDPYCWDRMVRESRPGKIIRLVTHLGGSACLAHKDVVRRGATALALADWLTANGYNVEIVGVIAGQNAGDGVRADWIATLPLKRSNEPMDIGALASATCDMSFARAVMLRGVINLAGFKLSSGLGMPMSQLPADLSEGETIHVPEALHSDREAGEWLAAAIGKLTSPEGE